jgi:hypothetical protein
MSIYKRLCIRWGIYRTSGKFSTIIPNVTIALDSFQNHETTGEDKNEEGNITTAAELGVKLDNRGKQQAIQVIQTSPICKLPTEVMLQVVDQLRPASAASLAFSCKQIRVMIGSRSPILNCLEWSS